LLKRHSLSGLLLLLLLGSACNVGAGEGSVEDRYLQGGNSQVDLLFIIDNSTSMALSQAQLSLAFPSILSVMQTLQADWQMAIITTDMTNPEHRGRLLEFDAAGTTILSAETPSGGTSSFQNALIIGTDGSQLERALTAAWHAIRPPLTSHDNVGFPRPGARLVMIVLSDEDDCSDEGALLAEGSAACVAQAQLLVPVEEYLERFLSTREQQIDLSFHAIIETGRVGELDGCEEGNSPGERYMEFAGRTGGSIHLICDDMDETLEDIGLQAAGRRRAFPLSRIPNDRFLDVRISGINDPEGVSGNSLQMDRTENDGWSYNSSTNMVQFWGPSVPPPGSQVILSYPVGFSY